MEYSNSLDNSRKKSRRVRSWYLYEQFKSLEKSQSDAAQKLKDRSYQERILRQELNERRERRRLCDQFGLCQSDSRIDRSVNNIPSKTLLSSSTDDLYESICKLHADDDIGDVCSCDDSISSKFYEECKTAHSTEDASKENSVTSVVRNMNYDDNLTDNLKEDLQSVQKNIAENINLQLETVKENIEYIEKYTKLCEEGKISEDESFNSVTVCECDETLDSFKTAHKNNVPNFFAFWSKLVTFSYNLMQISSGNCYSDYSTQLLTAVLACDILRRGLNKMCYILQPYVSPIKFAPSDEDIANSKKYYKNVKECKTNVKRKKLMRNEPKLEFLPQYKVKFEQNSNEKRYIVSDRKCRSFENRVNEQKWLGMNEPKSEPWHSVAKLLDSKSIDKSSSSIWPDDLLTETHKTNCKCCNIKGLVNSMLHLSRCLDRALRDVQSSNCL